MCFSFSPRASRVQSVLEHMSNKAIFTGAFTIVLLTLGVVDAVLTVEEQPFATLFQKNDGIVDEPKDPEALPPIDTDTSDPVDDDIGGTRKQTGADVGSILAEQKFEIETLSESIFLAKIVPPEDGIKVTGAILLKDGDRAGVLAWVDSPQVKLYFMALKEALHQSFTTAVKDLVDETQRREDKPIRNFLSFLDTGISEERIVFVRVRERLYEMHIAEGRDDLMFGLIDAITE